MLELDVPDPPPIAVHVEGGRVVVAYPLAAGAGHGRLTLAPLVARTLAAQLAAAADAAEARGRVGG